MIQKYSAIMRRSLPTFRLNNVIRLCALAMAMCFLMTTQSVWGARPKFVTHTHGTLASPIAVCYNQSPYNLIPLLGTLDSQAGNVETYTLIDMTTSGAIDTFPAHATAAGVVGGVLSAIYLTTPIAYWYPGTAHGIDSFSIVVSDGLTSDTTKFVFNIIAPPVAYPVSGRTYVYVGDQVTLSAGGTGGSLYWRSSNTSLATVDLITGVVNGVSAGNVIIYDSVSSPTCGDSMLAHPMVVLSSTPPSITSVGASESAVPGTSITIAGANFNATPSLNTVTFGGVETRPTAGSTTSLTVTVPYGAMNSNVSVLDDSSRLVVYDKLAFTPLFDNVGFNPGTLLNFRSNFNIQLPNGTGALGPIYKPYDITSADLDGDGKPDLIVAGSGADAGGLYHVRVYRNITPAGYLDTPSFAPVQLFQVGAYPVNVKAADLDGDGKLELIVACTGSAVSILKNTSTGGTISFAAKVDKVAGAGPMELAIADFDGDGRPDIGVTSSGFVPLNIPSTFTVIQNKTYVGQAFNTSSFVSDTIFTFQPGASGDFPISICAGDFNHDGLIDVAFSNKYKRKITIFQNRSVGHNSFIFDTAGRVDFSVAQGSSGYPNQIKTADIDGDGKLDLLVANSDSDLTAAGTYNALSVLHNTSTGGTITSSCFAAKVDFTTGLGPVALSIGDLDGDGKKDVITSNVDSSSLSILKNTSTSGTISFASRSDSFIHNPYVIPADGGPIGSVIVDLDSNQVPDIAVVSREGNVLSIFKHFPIPDTNTITTATGGDSVCINATLGMVSAIVHPGHESEYWKVTNTGIATIDSATGVVTGVAAGTDTVKLAVISLRDTVWLTHVIKVKPLPNPGTISGTSAVCVGDSIVLTPSVGAGTWSSSNAHASVDAAAEVTGVSAGSSVISYTVTTPSCGDSSSTHGVTVNPLPDAGVITGFGGMCPSSTVSLSESVGGGTWSSTNTTLATVSGTGVVHSLTLTGVDTIRYVVTTATCGNDTAIKSISIINLGSHTPIVPNTRNVCVGLQVTLTNAASGGTWSSSASGTASVSPSGVVTGVASGVATISYIEAYTCFTDTSYATVTVNPLASAGVITGSTHVCVGLVSFDTVTGSVGTGTWLSTNTAIANVGSSTGDVHGVANGTDTIMHISTNTCNSDTARQTIIVSAAANPGTISGATNLCVDSTVALTLTGADAVRPQWSS